MPEYVNMTMTVQVPIEIAQAAKNGQAEIMGLAKNATTKQTMKHLKVVEPAQEVVAKESVNAAVAAEPATKGVNKGAVAAVVAVGALAIAAGVTWLVVRHNKKKEEAAALTDALHKEISTYVDGVQSGTLDFEDLKRFTEFIGSITKDAKSRKLRIALSPEELAALRSIVAKVTVEAVKQKGDGSDIPAIAKPVVALEPIDMLDNIHQNLEFQQEVLEPVKVASTEDEKH